jgi:hypothetical protein
MLFSEGRQNLTKKKYFVSWLILFAKPPVRLEDNVLEIAENIKLPV